MVVIAQVDPKPAGAGLGQVLVQHFHRGVIGVDHFAGPHLLDHDVVERLEQFGTIPHPVAHRGAGDVDAVAFQDAFQAVQGQMVRIFADDHVSQEPRRRQPLLDGGQRLVGGDDLRSGLGGGEFASPARVGQPHVLDDLDLGRHVVELLVDLLGDDAAHLPAAGAGLFLFRQIVDHPLPRQVGGDFTPAVGRTVGRGGRRGGLGSRLCGRRGWGGGRELFQQLFEERHLLGVHLLRRAPVEPPQQELELVFHLRQLTRGFRQLFEHLLTLGGQLLAVCDELLNQRMAGAQILGQCFRRGLKRWGCVGTVRGHAK